MAKKRRKLDVKCPNSDCSCFGKVGLKNVIRFGKQPNGTQKYKCTECGRSFTRTVGTPFYRRRIKKDDIIQICKLLSEKTGFRAISRVTGHHLDTVRDVAFGVAEYCKKFNEKTVKDLKLSPVEVDEMWSFIKKRKRTA